MRRRTEIPRESTPFEEFDARYLTACTLRDFPADLHVHVSSVDVYGDLTSPATTREESPADLAPTSHYGFHKLLAEQIVEHYAGRWLIVRLGGMVGPGLWKNPVYDVLNGCPLRIHPDSQYQFIHTDEVARLVWLLVEKGAAEDAFNICGQGLMSPREIAATAGQGMDLSPGGGR
jgi:nucleoside-diphosphate-sugar epimerase